MLLQKLPPEPHHPSPPSGRSRIPAALACALAVWLAAPGVVQADWKVGDLLPSLAAAGLVGALPTLEGHVVLIDFWASWCGPCKKSFPVLDALYATYRARGLVVLAVSVDEDDAAMQAFLKKQAITFPVVRDAAQRLVAVAGVNAMPSSFLVDRSGVIRFVHQGFHGDKTEKAYAEEVEALLKK